MKEGRTLGIMEAQKNNKNIVSKYSLRHVPKFSMSSEDISELNQCTENISENRLLRQ